MGACSIHRAKAEFRLLVAAGEIDAIEEVAAVEPSFQQLHEDVCLADPEAIA